MCGLTKWTIVRLSDPIISSESEDEERDVRGLTRRLSRWFTQELSPKDSIALRESQERMNGGQANKDGDGEPNRQGW